MKICILTGAGISAESGIKTFRDTDGRWNEYDVTDVATPEGFYKNPKLVLDFYNHRRKEVADARPNKAHYALAALQHNENFDVTLITQNVDDLHEKAGSKKVLHMHGSLHESICRKCGDITTANEVMQTHDICDDCYHSALRPNIVWFGEFPYHMEVIDDALRSCDIFVAIGTSGTVYPAAGFVKTAKKKARAHTVEINLHPSDNKYMFTETMSGVATEMVPAFVEKLLSGEYDYLKSC